MSRVKDLTLADLGRKSIWRNTLIFDLLHRTGFVEKVGTGIRAEASVSVTFRPNPKVRAETEERPLDRVAGEVRLLRVLSGEMTRQRLQEALGLKHENHFREAYLIPALRSGLIEMTIPDKQQQTALPPDSGGKRIPGTNRHRCAPLSGSLPCCFLVQFTLLGP